MMFKKFGARINSVGFVFPRALFLFKHLAIVLVRLVTYTLDAYKDGWETWRISRLVKFAMRDTKARRFQKGNINKSFEVERKWKFKFSLFYFADICHLHRTFKKLFMTFFDRPFHALSRFSMYLAITAGLRYIVIYKVQEVSWEKSPILHYFLS